MLWHVRRTNPILGFGLPLLLREDIEWVSAGKQQIGWTWFGSKSD
jgi:hypothetical protein